MKICVLLVLIATYHSLPIVVEFLEMNTKYKIKFISNIVELVAED